MSHTAQTGQAQQHAQTGQQQAAEAKADPEPTAADALKYLTHIFPDFKAWVKTEREAEAKAKEAKPASTGSA